MTSLADSVLALTTLYLGPSSRRFLERQARTHLNNLDFDKLEQKHIPDLALWVKTSAGLLIDRARAEELSRKIMALAR